MRKTFAVGRITEDSAEIVLVDQDRDEPSPVPGPWTLRAVVRPVAPSRTAHATTRTVH